MPYQGSEAFVDCLYCKSKESLHGEIVIKKMMPLAKRNGTIKVGGQAITQIDIKNAWDQNTDGSPKSVRGPVYCVECGEEMHLIGSTLKKGPAMTEDEQIAEEFPCTDMDPEE